MNDTSIEQQRVHVFDPNNVTILCYDIVCIVLRIYFFFLYFIPRLD